MSEASRREFIQGGISAIVGLVALKSGLVLLPAEAAGIAEPRFSKGELLALQDRMRRLMWGMDLAPYNTGQYAQLFKSYKSTLAIERRAPITYLGLAELEKRVLIHDKDGNEPPQSYIWNFQHLEAALGFAATPEVSDEVLLQHIKALCSSFQNYREIQAANILNYGFTYDMTVGGDGVSVFSTQHPVDDGRFANTFPEYRPLTPDSLREARSVIDNFVDERNLKIMAQPRLLVVPVMQVPVVERMIFNGTFPAEMFPEGYVVNDYLLDGDSWYIKTNMEGLCHFPRMPLEMDAWLDHWDFDPMTDKPIEHPPQHVLGKGYERYSFGCADPRAIFGVMKKPIPRPMPREPSYDDWDEAFADGATGQVFREGAA